MQMVNGGCVVVVVKGVGCGGRAVMRGLEIVVMERARVS